MLADWVGAFLAAAAAWDSELESHGAVKELLKKLNSWDCQYSDFTLTKGAAGSRDCAVTLTVTLGHMGRKAAFIEAIQLLDFVSFCNEL